MSSEVLRVIDPRGYFGAFFKQGVFPDGRGLLDEQKLVFKQGECGGVGSAVVSTHGVTVSCSIDASVSLKSDGPLVDVKIEPSQQIPEKDAEDYNNLLLSLFTNQFFVRREHLQCLDSEDQKLPLEWQLHVSIKVLSCEANLLDAVVCAIGAALSDTRLPSIVLNHAESDESAIEKSQILADARKSHRLHLEPSLVCATFGVFSHPSSCGAETLLLLAPSSEATQVCEATCSVIVGDKNQMVLVRQRGSLRNFSLLKTRKMRFFGTYNRNKELYFDEQQVQAARRRWVARRFDVDFWLLIHTDSPQSNTYYDPLLAQVVREHNEVSHDDILTWFATAIRCNPQSLAPPGEAVGIRDGPTIAAGIRGTEWNLSVGVVQMMLLFELLSHCSYNNLTIDQRANALFAVLRVCLDSQDVSDSLHLGAVLRRLLPRESRHENMEAFAPIFFQIACDVGSLAYLIRLIWKTIEDEPLVLRLTVEVLMCLSQRAEISRTLPDFSMGDQMYCNQIRVIILDLTSDAHVQVRELSQKNELSSLVNEVFNLTRRDGSRPATSSAPSTSTSST